MNPKTAKDAKNVTLIDRQKVGLYINSQCKYSRLTAVNTNNYSQVCPFFLRTFLCEGKHFPMSEYTNRKIPPKARELQIYTWLDATLSELMGLIRELPEYRNKGYQFSFSVVFPEPTHATYRMRHIGVTVGGKRGPDDDLTLAQCRYQIGDFIDVAILPPGADPSKIQASSKSNRARKRGGGAGGDRGGPQGRFHR